MANEIAIIEKFIVAQLRADGGLMALANNRFFAYSIPAGSVFPAVLLTYLAGSDTQGNGSRRQMTRARYQIKAIGRGAMDADLMEIANAVDDIFQNATGVSFENKTFSSRRIQPISYRESAGEPETSFRHLGGIYRIDCY